MVQSPIIPQIQLNWHYLEIMSYKKLKAWNIVLDHNEDSKIQLHNFLYPRSPNCRWFQLLFLTHDRFIEPKAEKHKNSIWLQKEVNNSIQQDFLNRVPLYCGWFHWFCYFWVMTILSNQKLNNAKYRFWLQRGVKNSIR